MLPCKCYNTWQITHFLHQSKTFLASHAHQFTFYVHCEWWKTYLHLLPRHVAEACHCVAVCPSVASLVQTLWGCRSPRCPLQLHTSPSLPRPMELPRCSGWPQAEGPQSPCPVFSSLSQREKENTERPSCRRATLNATIENLCMASQIKVKKKEACCKHYVCFVPDINLKACNIIPSTIV